MLIREAWVRLINFSIFFFLRVFAFSDCFVNTLLLEADYC